MIGLLLLVGFLFMLLFIYKMLKASRDAWRDWLDTQDPKIVRKYWPTYKDNKG